LPVPCGQAGGAGPRAGAGGSLLRVRPASRRSGPLQPTTSRGTDQGRGWRRWVSTDRGSHVSASLSRPAHRPCAGRPYPEHPFPLTLLGQMGRWAVGGAVDGCCGAAGRRGARVGIDHGLQSPASPPRSACSLLSFRSCSPAPDTAGPAPTT